MRTADATLEPVRHSAIKEFLKRLPLLVALVRGTRRLAQRWGQAWGKTRWVNARKIQAYLDTQRVRKLHIGSGPHRLPGWLNTDFEYVFTDTAFLDATRPFPFGEATFDYAFSEHMIEHISYAQGLFMLRECHRVLKPGGRIRIATPNLKNLIALYPAAETEMQKRYLHESVTHYYAEPKVHTACFLINQFLRTWGHQFVYDPPTLRDALEKAGFNEVSECPPDESADPNLRGIESHGKQIGEDFNRFETMVLEARRA